MTIKGKKWQWLIVAMGLFMAGRQAMNIWQLYKSGEQVRLAESQVQQAEAENQSLKQKLAQIDNPEFIEKEAREKLGMAKEGETILILPTQNKVDSGQLTVDSDPSWKQWWDLYIRI